MKSEDPLSQPKSFEAAAWVWMRYSAILLIPLLLGHVFFMDIWTGVTHINIFFVDQHWKMAVWRVYDAFLLVFALAHGVNGLRQVLIDLIPSARLRSLLGWFLFLLWMAISLVGMIAIIGGARAQL
jgi:succinate dehydrogenase / fumarate reductase, membrane anchor subunit